MVQHYKCLQIILKCSITYKKNPSLFLHDSLILYALIGILIITLYKCNSDLLILILLLIFMEIDLKVYSYYQLFNYLPLILLHLSLLNVVYHYFFLLSTITLFMFTLILLLSCSFLYTLYLIRSNKDAFTPKCGIKQWLKQTWLLISSGNWILIFLLVLTFIISLFMRYIILLNISFSASLLYISLLYLILFSLWLPGLLISYTLINCYYYNNRFNFSDFKLHFSLENLKILFLFMSITFSFKCMLFLTLDITLLYYKDKPKLLVLPDKYVKHLKYLLANDRQSYNRDVRTLRSGLGWTPFAIGVLLTFVDDKHDTYHEPKSTKSYKELLDNGYKYDKSTQLITPGNIDLDATRGLYKQIEKFNKYVYVRITEDHAEKLSNLKGHTTKSLDKQKDLFLVKGFPNIAVNSIINAKAMQDELLLMDQHPTDESYTYGFMNMLLTEHFKVSNGYVVSPQSKQVDGAVDFIVKKHGEVIAVVESKALDAKNYPFTHLYAQATEYANTNHSLSTVFVIVNKGRYISFGQYVEDFHSANHFKKKCTLFDGYIGLQVHNDLSVKPVPQLNVFEPQHKLYKAGHSREQNKSIDTCIKYIKNNTPVRSDSIDFGNYKLDHAGHLVDWDAGKEIKSKARFCVTDNGIIYDKYN